MGMPRSRSRSEGPTRGPAEITNSWAGEGLSMSLECLKKAAPSCDRLPLTLWKPPAAPTGIRRFKFVSYQNAAGLWLKYGV
jgi:hypothetical protein